MNLAQVNSNIGDSGIVQPQTTGFLKEDGSQLNTTVASTKTILPPVEESSSEDEGHEKKKAAVQLAIAKKNSKKSSSDDSDTSEDESDKDNSVRFGISKSKALIVVLFVIICGLIYPAASFFYNCNECCSEIKDIQKILSSKFAQNESFKNEMYSWIVSKIDLEDDCRQTKMCQEKLDNGEGVLFKVLVWIAPNTTFYDEHSKIKYNQTHRFVDRCVGSCKNENHLYQNIRNYTATFPITYMEEEINSTEILIHTKCDCVCNPIIKRNCNKTTHEYSEDQCTCIKY